MERYIIYTMGENNQTLYVGHHPDKGYIIIGTLKGACLFNIQECQNWLRDYDPHHQFCRKKVDLKNSEHNKVNIEQFKEVERKLNS